MDRIELQQKTKALPGSIESYWFENEHIGLVNTLFHRVTIPLASFDSGLDYEEQPLETKIVLEWYELNLQDPTHLDGLNLSHEAYPEAEASVYVGSAHNWCDVKRLELKHIGEDLYEVSGELVVEFENEGVGENEPFSFTTIANYIRS